MPLVLIIIGVTLLYTEYNGTSSNLFSLVQGDFSGTNSFEKYLLGLIVIGSIGYIPRVKPISDAFLALVIVVLLLKNQAFFSNLNSSLNG